LKICLLYLLIIVTITIEAKRIRLSFIPQKPLLAFHYGDIIVYTDTASLFFTYSHGPEEFQKDYFRVKRVVLTKPVENKNDTITFFDEPISFNDSLRGRYSENWDIVEAFVKLIDENKLKVVDKQKREVKVIGTKIIKLKRNERGIVWRQYIDRRTNQVLFSEAIGYRMLQ
jgi:hypothetical protein